MHLSSTAVRRHLNHVRTVALVDALLLAPLLIAAVLDAEGAVRILGPLHGLGYLLLIYLVIQGAMKRMWGWWFPAIVVITLGPLGSLIGDLRVRRALPSIP